MDAEQPTWRPVQGLVEFANTMKVTPRGMVVKENLLYTAQDGFGLTVTANGVVTLLSGALSGANPVTWAQHNKSPTPDLICNTENGSFIVTSSTITSFLDPDLPQPNSITQLDGYFLWTIGDGRIFASELNSTAVNALSFTTAQANPDGLLRGTVHGQQFFAWGQSSIQVYQDVGTTPFPLSPVTIIPVGLIEQWAIAGYEPGWGGPQIFVASDGTVRKLNGYTPEVVSTKDVERAIHDVSNKALLRASVYVEVGHPIWSLSSPTWTWEYNNSTGYWHERASSNMTRWRAEQSALFFNNWIIGDTTSGKLFRIDEAVFTEDGNAIAMTLESGPVKNFPARIQVASAFFDWTTGTAPLVGSDDAVNPSVSISWSHDGGASYSGALLRRSLGTQGQVSKQIRVNRLGLSTQHGMRFRLVTTSPIYRTFRGGSVNAASRGPA